MHFKPSGIEKLIKKAESLERRKALLGKTQEQRKAMLEQSRRGIRQRRSELHPDKLGRDQTPAERAEYAKLTKRKGAPRRK